MIFFRLNHQIGGFFVRTFLALLVVTFLSSCTSNRAEQNVFSAFYDAYLELSEDKNVTKLEAEKLPYAAMTVSFNKQQSVLMPLGYLSNNQQKWYSQDRVGFTTQNARIVQVYNVQSEITAIDTHVLWKRFDVTSMALNQVVTLPIELDFLSLNRFSVKGSLTLQGVGFEERLLWNEPVRLFRIEEQVSIPSMNYVYTNIYWKDPITHFVWESVQKWGPEVPTVHYQVVKPWKTVSYP